MTPAPPTLPKHILPNLDWKLTMKTCTFLVIAALLAFTVGCEVPEVDTSQSSVASTPVEEVPAETEDETIDMSGVPNEPPPVTSTPREFEAKDAKKGKKSRKAGGYLGAVAGARFWAEHEMIRNSYTHAMNLYNAEKGHYPKTHEEFMEKIIKFNNIVLPELEPGVEYLYDPEDHTLKIHRPEG